MTTMTLLNTELNNQVVIEGPPNPLLAGDSYAITCTAIADITPVVRWMDSGGNPVEEGEGLTLSGPIVSGNATTLRLTFNYLRTSQAGAYSCLSIIDVPTSIQRAIRDVIIQSKSVSDHIQTHSLSTYICTEKVSYD